MTTVQHSRWCNILPVLLARAAVLMAFAAAAPWAAAAAPLTAFSTGGHIVYHLRPATVDASGQRAIVSAAYDGTVLCHDQQGRLLWKTRVNDYFPYDLAVADLDDDGHDEILVATAGGTIDLLDSDGKHLWTYTTEAPLFQVCAVRTGNEWLILTGGIEEEVVTLSATGKRLRSFAAGDVVRHIRKGQILGDGREQVAIATASTGLQGDLSLMLYDPVTSQTLWRITGLGRYTPNSGNRFFSMIMMDLNRDGKAEIVVCGRGRKGEISAYDHKGERVMFGSDPRIPDPSYSMLLLSGINLGKDSEEYILGLYGQNLIIYNRDGSLRSILRSKFDFTNCAFDAQTGTYFLGSSPAGGDGIYALHLNDPGWEKAFETIRPVGRMAQIEQNVERLKAQIKAFRRPAYQPAPTTRMTLLAEPPPGMEFDRLGFATTLRLYEKYKDRSELWCRSVDRRYTYNMTAEEILKIVSDQDKTGVDFMMWAGHGDAFYMSPATLGKILAADYKHFKGFLFAEMSRVDANMEEVVRKLLLPLAEQCSKAGKKIKIRNKNIFWNATCYLDFWKDVLLDPRYSDVFIPSLEETNCRTQELSLAGRQGLWLTGSFDNWADRLVKDNACFDRFWEWTSDVLRPHYLRQMVLHASMGATIFSVSPASEDLLAQMAPIYEMLEKGVIAIPQRDELLSVADFCVGMREPSKEFMTHSITSGLYNFNEVKQPTPMVFDRLKTYWAGAPLLEHDFSKYAYNCERRMLNFLPETPYGMIAILPDDTRLEDFPRFRDKVSTDGQYFYDANGRHSPAEYKPVVLEKLRRSAARLPVLVRGDVAWSVVRIDPTHVRVTLVDSGYTDPADRSAEIVLQHLNGIECADILSGEKLTIAGGKISISVPAGIFRIVDIRHEGERPGAPSESSGSKVGRQVPLPAFVRDRIRNEPQRAVGPARPPSVEPAAL